MDRTATEAKAGPRFGGLPEHPPAEDRRGLAIPVDADWPAIDGDLLGNRRLSVPAFPIDFLVPPWRDWVTASARATAAPVDYVAQAVLAAVAGIAGGGVWLRITSAWAEPLLLWLAAVGAPSTGKSPALTSVRRLLTALEGEQRGEDGEPLRRILVSERKLAGIAGTPVDTSRGMLLWRDEASGCFAPVAGRRSARQFETSPVSILGSIEPDAAAQTLQRGEDGLSARFLYAWPSPPVFHPLAERQRPPNDAVLAALRRQLAAVGTLQEPLALVLDPSGTATFESFLAGLHVEQRQAEGLEAAWLGKGGGAVARLAGVLELLSWSALNANEPPRLVRRQSVEQAVSLWSDYYRPHALAFFQRAAPTDLACQVRRTVGWLRTEGRTSVSREDVRRTALGQMVNAGQADRVLTHLVAAGVLRRMPNESRPQGGRPALRWQVNPRLQTA